MPTLVATRAWRALARLAGGRCLICRAWCREALCAACDASFAAPSARCPGCAARLACSPGDEAGSAMAPSPRAPSAPRCARCRAMPPPWSAAVAAVDYAPPWDALVAAFKFAARVDLAVTLSPLLARAVTIAHVAQDMHDTHDTHADASAPLADLVVPVPLARHRLRERGYNQAWELARRTARAHGLGACADALFRVRDTPRQATLSRAARAANLRDAFAVSPRHAVRVRGARIALVDDVLTTGATAGAAAQALRRGGAADVRLWVFARTTSETHATPHTGPHTDPHTDTDSPSDAPPGSRADFMA